MTTIEDNSQRRKTSLNKWKSFPHSNKSIRGARSKKWNRDIYSDILEINNHTLLKPDEEEAIGIITLEDVIEELLQVRFCFGSSSVYPLKNIELPR